MITGFHQGTPERLQLGAGIFLKNFSLDGISSAQVLKQKIAQAVQEGSCVMGATRGGGMFSCAPMLRSMEADGLRAPFVGSTVNDGWIVKLKGTLLEITPENIASALACATVSHNGNLTVVQARNELTQDDYIPRLCWIGDTAKGAVLIELTGAVNLRGVAFTFHDRREGELPFEFQAHAEACDQDTAPFRMLFLN